MDLEQLIQTIVNQAITEHLKTAANYRKATVTAITPTRIQLDGDTTPLAITPTALAVVSVGDRVLCLMSSNQVTILGVIAS